jgi:hypothetical protein
LPERRNASLSFRISRSRTHEHPDPAHALALLRASNERHCNRTADKRDELAPPHIHPGQKTGHRTGKNYCTGRGH